MNEPVLVFFFCLILVVIFVHLSKTQHAGDWHYDFLRQRKPLQWGCLTYLLHVYTF